MNRRSGSRKTGKASAAGGSHQGSVTNWGLDHRVFVDANAKDISWASNIGAKREYGIDFASSTSAISVAAAITSASIRYRMATQSRIAKWQIVKIAWLAHFRGCTLRLITLEISWIGEITGRSDCHTTFVRNRIAGIWRWAIRRAFRFDALSDRKVFVF
jgi:hypothetical protein